MTKMNLCRQVTEVIGAGGGSPLIPTMRQDYCLPPLTLFLFSFTQIYFDKILLLMKGNKP
jgi:hypothetical protein